MLVTFRYVTDEIIGTIKVAEGVQMAFMPVETDQGLRMTSMLINDQGKIEATLVTLPRTIRELPPLCDFSNFIWDCQPVGGAIGGQMIAVIIE